MTAATRESLLQLAAPFAPGDIEWRIQTAGEKNGQPWARVLAYITNRAIMERLDTIVGPENWRNEFKPSVGAKEGGVLCGLAIRVACAASPDGEWVAKWDGADETDIEATKGGISSAMKRAGVQWGIGRYLYELEEGWAQVSEQGRFSAKTREGKWFKWDPPTLPTWAMPGGSGKPDGTPRSNGSPAPVSRSASPAPAPRAIAPAPTSATPSAPRSPTPSTANDAPECPKCGGRTWDNRLTKQNPKAPDFKCRDRSCDGVIWPPRDAKPVAVAMAASGDEEWAPIDDGGEA